jgi:hypothetical protein
MGKEELAALQKENADLHALVSGCRAAAEDKVLEEGAEEKYGWSPLYQAIVKLRKLAGR